MNPTFDASSGFGGGGGGGDGLWSAMTRIFGLSMFASMFLPTGRDATTAGGGGGRDSVRLIVLGILFELGRRFVKWVFERFRLRTSPIPTFFLCVCVMSLNQCARARVCALFSLIEYSITAEFSESDPAYDWIINFIVRSGGWGGIPLC